MLDILLKVWFNVIKQKPDFDRTGTMKHFVDREFECKCGCGLNNMRGTFLDKIDYARDRAGIQFVIASGCRCEAHNKAEGGKSTSDHLTGEGVDIACETSFARWRIVRAGIAAGIRRIGIAKTFIHLGDNLNNPNPRIWVY
jgi:hypothetical protein